MDEVPEPGSTAFDDLVVAARRKRTVVVRSVAGRAPWAADAIMTLGASGAPLTWTGRCRDLPDGLSSEIVDVITDDVRPDRHGRELHSIRVRRAALRQLDRQGSCDDVPGVSVLLASKRPADVERAVGFVARQRHVDVQLLVGLHGSGWNEESMQNVRASAPDDTEIVQFDAERSLGELLGTLTSMARHELVTKWDDDDWYGPDHLGDLCLAYRYSGADVVGKAAEFVFVERSDMTIRRFAHGAESYSRTLAGGTLMTSTEWLERIGGWRPVARGVDRELLADTERVGGTSYRTHGFQYVLRRRGDAAHTWAAPDRGFLAAATDRRPGLDLVFADVEVPS